MERFDVLIVGAGPAGSTAAYRLATEGASVLLADRATFPRDKPCGGGLTMRAVRQLPFSVEPVVEDRTMRVRLGLDFTRRIERTLDEPLVLMTQRSRLDAHLVEQAVRAGARVSRRRQGDRSRARGDGVEAKVDGSRVAADHALLADGANGVSARAVGLDGGRDYGVALEANVPYGAVPKRTTAACSAWSWRTSPAGTAGSSRRATTSTSESAAGRAKARGCGEHLAALLPRVRHPESSLEDVRGHRPAARPPARTAREGTRRAPRRRRRPRRPALR